MCVFQPVLTPVQIHTHLDTVWENILTREGGIGSGRQNLKGPDLGPPNTLEVVKNANSENLEFEISYLWIFHWYFKITTILLCAKYQLTSLKWMHQSWIFLMIIKHTGKWFQQRNSINFNFFWPTKTIVINIGIWIFHASVRDTKRKTNHVSELVWTQEKFFEV